MHAGSVPMCGNALAYHATLINLDKKVEDESKVDENENAQRKSLAQRWLSSRTGSNSSLKGSNDRLENKRRPSSPIEAKQSLLTAAAISKSRSRSPMVGRVLSKATTFDSAESLRLFLLEAANLENSKKSAQSNKIPLGTKAKIVRLLPNKKVEITLNEVSGKVFRTDVHLLKRPLPTNEISQGSTVSQTACFWVRSPSLVLLSIATGILNTVGLVLANFIHTRKGGFFGPHGFRTARSLEILLLFSWMPFGGGCLGVFFGGIVHDNGKSTTKRLYLLATACGVSVLFAISVLLLPVPWAFIGFLLQQITGEIWPGITMASIVDLSPPQMRSRIIAFHYLIVANTAGVAVYIVSFLTSRNVLNLQQALMIFYPGMLTIGAILLILCAKVASDESVAFVSHDNTFGRSLVTGSQRQSMRTGRKSDLHTGLVPSSFPSQLDDIIEDSRGMSYEGGPDTPLAPRIYINTPGVSRENSRDAMEPGMLSPMTALQTHSRRAISDRTTRSDGRYSESTELLMGTEGMMSPAAANRLYGSFSPGYSARDQKFNY